MSLSRRVSRVLLFGAVATALTGSVIVGVALPAHAASDKGLYGSSDPTYDGVIRQSLALWALAENGVTPAPAAIRWLVSQQCADGSFQGYRSNTSIPCEPFNAETFSGPDSNSTATAAVALYLTGRTAEARKAITWLNSIQNPDGGWPYSAGADSDTNSTGLSLLALRTVQPQDRSARVPQGQAWLSRTQFACNTSTPGAFPFQPGGGASMLASTDAIVGLAVTEPIEPASVLTRNPACKGNTARKAAHFLAQQVMPTGVIPGDFGGSPDYSSTARAVIAMSELGVGKAAVNKGLQALKRNARAYALPDGVAQPGALGLLMLTADATDSSLTSFGGINLTRTLTASMR